MKDPVDEIFIYPTDTVWGIGCSIYSETGHDEIARIKKSSKNKPLSIMFGSIEEVMNSFHIPKAMSRDWLSDFFKLETTLGLEIKASKIKIPKWATGDSGFVNIRCLETDVVKQMFQEIGAPFFTTSLNISGEPPIVEMSEAMNFQKTFAPRARFINSRAKNSSRQLSGFSSTIVFINENEQFEIKREGKRIEDVKKMIKQIIC